MAITLSVFRRSCCSFVNGVLFSVTSEIYNIPFCPRLVKTNDEMGAGSTNNAMAGANAASLLPATGIYSW